MAKLFFVSFGILVYGTTAGPESLANYFQKVELLCQKVELNLWYVYTRLNSQKLFPSIWKSFIFFFLIMSSYIFYSNNSIVYFQ